MYDLKPKELIRKSNEAHISKACNKNKARRQTINKQRSSNENISDSPWQIKEGEGTIDDVNKIANLLNSHFINVAGKK